jgi:hypothetical protein
MQNRASFQDHAVVAWRIGGPELNYLKDSGFLDAGQNL